MVLTNEQVKELKEQLSEQIRHLPQEKRAQAQKQIDDMSEEALEHMLNQQVSASPKRDDILRMIVEGIIPAKKIDENSHAIAVLEIRPVTRGHVMIIPKNPVKKSEQIPSQVFTLAKKIAKTLALKLKATGSEIQTELKFGEYVINIIPHSEKPIDYNKRYDASEKELEEIQGMFIKTKKKTKPIKITKEVTSNTIKLKRRIP